MRAYRVASGRTIAPFGDLVRDLYVGVKTLSTWQEEAAGACGLSLSDIEEPSAATERPCILFGTICSSPRWRCASSWLLP